jgi:hypothetical protein
MTRCTARTKGNPRGNPGRSGRRFRADTLRRSPEPAGTRVADALAPSWVPASLSRPTSARGYRRPSVRSAWRPGRPTPAPSHGRHRRDERIAADQRSRGRRRDPEQRRACGDRRSDQATARSTALVTGFFERRNTLATPSHPCWGRPGAACSTTHWS